MINEIAAGNTETKFKDRLFKAIFGRDNPQSKQWRLELYNALRGTNYTNPEDLELNTIENVIYLTMRNDISFLVDSQMTLLEQQSTYNPNMPLRGLMYFSQLYQMHLSRQRKTLFRTNLVKIPNLKFIVFYNGTKETEDKELLKLSDAFEVEDNSGQYEWTAELININPNHNKTLQKNCKPLYDYVRYVSRINENKKRGLSTQEAVNDAVEWATRKDLLDGFFKLQKEEVLAMSLTEFDVEEFRRDIREEGFEDGSLQKAIDATIELLKEKIAPEVIAKCEKLPLEKVLELQEQIKVKV